MTDIELLPWGSQTLHVLRDESGWPALQVVRPPDPAHSEQ